MERARDWYLYIKNKVCAVCVYIAEKLLCGR